MLCYPSLLLLVLPGSRCPANAALTAPCTGTGKTQVAETHSRSPHKRWAAPETQPHRARRSTRGARAGQRLSLAGERSKRGHAASANYWGSVLPLWTLVQPGAAVDPFNQTQRRPRSSKPHRNPHLGKPSQPGRLLAEPPAPGGAQATR